MIYYFDTSALLKRYVLEEGSLLVQGLFDDVTTIASTASITSVEGCHVICRKCSEESVSQKNRQKLLKAFVKDLKDIKIITYSPQVVKLAQKIIKSSLLKTLDAIHIASALILKRPGNIHFVSSDDQQNRIAKHYGLKVINPLQT